MLYLVDSVGGDRGVRAPRRQRHALFPRKDVALFLQKEQGKETEAVNVCIIKRKETQTDALPRRSAGDDHDRGPRARLCGAPPPAARQPPPAKGRRSLPAKEKGKETEAVSRCMINMNKDKQLT